MMHMSPCQRPTVSVRQKGAVIILLAIVIVVASASVMLSVLSRTYGDPNPSAAESHDDLNQARAALLGFAAIHKRLPCPAVSASNGNEKASCISEAAATGFLPWTSLGVPKLDRWGKIVRYSVSPTFAPGSGTPVSKSGAIATKTVQERIDGSLAYLPGASCNPANRCVAIVYSQGARNFGYTTTGSAVPNDSPGIPPSNLPGNSDEMANNGATSNFIRRFTDRDLQAPGGEFDDMIVWIDYDTFNKQMMQAGGW